MDLHFINLQCTLMCVSLCVTQISPKLMQLLLQPATGGLAISGVLYHYQTDHNHTMFLFIHVTTVLVLLSNSGSNKSVIYLNRKFHCNSTLRSSQLRYKAAIYTTVIKHGCWTSYSHLWCWQNRDAAYSNRLPSGQCSL